MKDGRLEPLLNVPKQEAAMGKYVKGVQARVKWATAATAPFVRAKARSIVNNNRYLWKVGRWSTNGKTGVCTWLDEERVHPYTSLMEEGPITSSSRKVAQKMVELKKLHGFEVEDVPNSKAECLQGDARKRLGTLLPYR